MALIKPSRAHMASFELGCFVGCLASEGLAYCSGEPHLASEPSTQPLGPLDRRALRVLFVPLHCAAGVMGLPLDTIQYSPYSWVLGECLALCWVLVIQR